LGQAFKNVFAHVFGRFLVVVGECTGKINSISKILNEKMIRSGSGSTKLELYEALNI
jgi:hypothetical protein